MAKGPPGPWSPCVTDGQPPYRKRRPISAIVIVIVYWGMHVRALAPWHGLLDTTLRAAVVTLTVQFGMDVSQYARSAVVRVGSAVVRACHVAARAARVIGRWLKKRMSMEFRLGFRLGTT